MKRIISVIFMAVILCIMVSCGENTSDSENPAGKKETPAASGESAAEAYETDPYDPGLPAKDFGGMEFRILTIDPDDTYWWSNTQIEADSETGDIINDAIYKRNRSVASKYNFTVNVTYMPEAQLAPAIKNTVSSGINEYELVIPPVDKAAVMAHSGYLHNLYGVEYLDFTKNWWNLTTLHNYSIGSRLYFATGDFILSDDDAITIMMYNKNLARDLNTPSAEELYDVVAEGNWTIDMLFGIAAAAPADLNGDAKVNYGDRFGLAACGWVQAAFMSACNEPLTAKDENDLPVFTAGSEQFIQIFQKVNPFLADKQLVAFEYSTVTPQTLGDLVMNDYSLFTAADLSCVRLYRAMESDFAILPFPKFDNSQEKYYSFMVTSTCMAIPTSNTNSADTGFILEALNAESGRLVNPAYYEQSVAIKYLRDDKSFQILELILENPVCDVLYWVYHWGGFGTAFDSLLTKPNADIVSTVDKNRAKVETAIQNTVDTYAALP